MKRIFIFLTLTTVLYSCKKEIKEITMVEDKVEKTLTKMEQNLNKYVSVKLTADLSSLSDKERQMLPVLIDAAEKMNDLFWYEAYGDGQNLLLSIE
jgi:hypothetical protein